MAKAPRTYVNCFSITGLARYVGVSKQTIQNWDKLGYLPESSRNDHGERIWNIEQAKQVLAFRKTRTPEARAERRKVYPPPVDKRSD